MSLNRRNFLAAGFGLAASAVAMPVLGKTRDIPVPRLTATIGTAMEAKSSDGLKLSIKVYGSEDAPEILFLHGLGQSRLSWDRQVTSLADRFRVVTWDLRGHGASGKPAAESAYADAELWADDVQAVIDATGLRRPTLVGWSFGGYVIGQYLAKYGNGSIAGVNLVDAVTKFDYELFGASGLKQSLDLVSPDIAVRSAAIVNFLAACFAIRPEEATFDQMVAYNGMVPVQVHVGIGQLSDPDVDDAFASVEHLLVTYGEKDNITSFEMSRRLLDINPNATMSVYQDAGHAPFYDDAARFNAELAEFVAR